MNMEQEMEMTRDELNKMTKRDLIEHIAKHGKKPQRKNILKGNLIDLIIKEGFNRPPPEIPKEEVTSTEIQVRPNILDKLKFRIVEFSSEEISKCKTRAEVDDLVDKKMAGPIRYMGEGYLNQLD
jgi:hypothetical protein